jgi:uncharacterized protein
MQSVEVRFDAGTVPIDGYGKGGFRIGGQIFRGSVAVVPDGVTSLPGLHDLSLILERADGLEVVLVGMGPALVAPGPAFQAERSRLEAVGIGVELMTTPSACRTYNVLLAEGRRVAAALVPI